MLGGTTKVAPARVFALASFALIIVAIALLPARATAATGWQIVLDRPTPNFGAVDFVSDSEGWMPTGAGLLHTTDGGATWTEAATMSGIDVDFADPDHGWLVGGSGAIYATTDGGATWAAQNSGTNIHLINAHAVSPQEAWILGEYKGYSDIITFPVPTTLLHTTDGGATWLAVDLPPNMSFSEMTFVGSSGWLLGQGCTPPAEFQYCTPDTVDLFRTSDGGATWTLQETDLPGIVHSLTFADGTHGWLSASACPMPDNCTFGVYRTTDGGATWTLGQLPTGFVGPTAFRDSMTGWIVEQDCNVVFVCSTGLPATHVLRTNDGGATWSPVGLFALPSPLQTASDLSLHSGALYLTGLGVALHSNDEGQTWSGVQHPAMTFDSNIDFVDRDTGYFISRGDLLRTTDAGHNWSRAGAIPNGAQSFIRFLDAMTGFTTGRTCNAAGACAAQLWRTSDGGHTWQQVLEIDDENAYVLDVRLAGPQHAFAALSTGVAVSGDGGATWTFQAAPPGQGLSAFAVADATHFWAVLATVQYPNTYELGRSTDEGRTWETVQTLSANTSSLLFVDREHGWYVDYVCANDAGCIAKLHATSNGGSTWHEQDPGASALNDVVFADQLNGWANATGPSFGSGEALLHSADGGETWTAQLTGGFVVGQLEFVDVEHGWLALSQYRSKGIGGGPPNRTVLYHTTDGGGGPIGVVPPEFPGVGGRSPSDSGGFALPMLLGAAGAIAFAAAFAAAFALRRRG